MTRQYIGLNNNPFTVDFKEHDISGYEALYHVTGKDRVASIEAKGLLLNQPQRKSLIDTGLLFMSYPIDENTSDCFRWHDDTCALVVLNAPELHKDGFIFYDDFWGMEDQSSKRNHLMIDKDIPTKYFLKILQF